MSAPVSSSPAPVVAPTRAVVSSWSDVTDENAFGVVCEVCNNFLGRALSMNEASILHQGFERTEKKALSKRQGDEKKTTVEPAKVTTLADLTPDNYLVVLRNLLDAKVRQGFGMLDAAMLNRCLELCKEDVVDKVAEKK